MKLNHQIEGFLCLQKIYPKNGGIKMKTISKETLKYLLEIFKKHYEDILKYSLEILKIFILLMK